MKNRKIKINFKDANMIKDFVKTVERYNSDVDIMVGQLLMQNQLSVFLHWIYLMIYMYKLFLVTLLNVENLKLRWKNLSD